MGVVTTTYKRTVTQIGDFTAIWDSEDNKVQFTIERKLKNGASIGCDRFTLSADELSGFTSVINTVMAAIHAEREGAATTLTGEHSASSELAQHPRGGE